MSQVCPNCNFTDTHDADYCSACGQKFGNSKLTVGEFLKDLVDQLFALETTFFKTLSKIFIPGELTIEYFTGLRKKYYHPLAIVFYIVGTSHFVPDLPAPWGRTVMIPRVDDDILVEVEVVSLSGVEFSDGRLKSNLLKVFEGFSRERQTPVWRFRLKGRRLEKRVNMSYGHNSVYVEYRLVEGDPVSLRLRPFVTFRTLDAGLRDAWHPPFPLTVVNGRHEMHLCEGAPSLKLCLRPHGGVFVVDDEMSAGIFYRVDQDRGLDHVECLASPGYFSADLAQDRSLAFVASTESWERLECDQEAIFAAEGERLDTFLSHVPDKQDEGIEGWLSLAADQFVVAPGSRLEEQAPARAHVLVGPHVGKFGFQDDVTILLRIEVFDDNCLVKPSVYGTSLGIHQFSPPPRKLAS